MLGLALQRARAKPYRRRVVASRANRPAPVSELFEVLLIVPQDELHVPQAREHREAFRQPDIAVVRRLHADPPPLVSHLVGAEDLLPAGFAGGLEGPP